MDVLPQTRSDQNPVNSGSKASTPDATSPDNGPDNGEIQNLHRLRQLLEASLLSLFSLPDELESRFRKAVRTVAARFLQKSVYSLIVLYLLVVTPVLIFSTDADKTQWFWWAVFPIGAVLTYLFIGCRFEAFERHVELHLGVCLAICVTGTLYTSFFLTDRFLGYVAGFETVYIIIIGFSVLRIRTSVSLLACLASLFLACSLSVFNGVRVDMISMILFFVSPLMVGVINGYIQESTSRRDFVLNTYQHGQIVLLKKIMLSGENGDETDFCLQDALANIAHYMEWSGLRVYVEDMDRNLLIEAEYAQRQEDNDIWQIEDLQEFVQDVCRLHQPRQKSILQDGQDTGKAYLAFPIQVSRFSRGVLLCRLDSCEHLDEEFVDFMGQVSDHIGRFLERMKQERILRTMALHDSLTGLKNRAAFMEALDTSFHRFKRHPWQQFCVLFMDLDRFKWVNDHLGHQAGDELLVEFSERLLDTFRQNDVISRLGGDEFAVIVEDVSFREIIRLVERVQNSYKESISLNGESVQVVASIGVSFVQERHKEAGEVLAEADAAMYEAKGRETGSYHIFEIPAKDTIARQVC